MRQSSSRKFPRKKRDYAPLIMLAPAILLICVVMLYPILNAVRMSFQYYVMWNYKNIHYVGLQNYLDIWGDAAFRASLGNSLRWIFVTVLFQFLLGLILALLLNRKFRGRGIVRSMVMIPWVTSGVIISVMWSWIYNGNFGVLNDLLNRLGVIRGNVAWLANPNTVLNAEIVTMIWQGTPFFCIMMLAAMQAIPLEQYEAADVEGANGWQRFWHITLPYLLPTVFITTLLRIIWVANNVDIIYLMTQGGPGYSSLTLSVYAYMTAQKSMNFGYGSALAIYGTLFMVVIMVIYLRMMAKSGGGIARR